MRRTRTMARLLGTAVLGLAATGAGCDGTATLGPVQPEDVTVRLAVTGGFAGVDYAFVVDGARRIVVGVSCGAHCGFEVGETLLALSSAQVADLADRLDRAGMMDLDGRDFGTQCCDEFEFALTYERGVRSARVTGSGSRLPDDLAAIVGTLVGFRDGIVPMIVAPATDEADWPQDAYALGSVEIDGSALRADVSFSGGCADHRMDLVAWGGWLESFPVQVNALVTHDDGDDPCDAWLSEQRAFDLRPLREAYGEAYGSAPPGTTVVLRLRDPTAGGPGIRLVEVVF